METERKPPTMTDIAREAGVSAMTVSRALRPDSSISDETRARIVAIADRLGYVMDSTAVGFSTGRSGFVGVVIPSINNSNFADTVRGLSEGLRQSGREILLGYTDYDVMVEEQIVEQCLRRRPEAMVLTGGVHTERCRRLLSRAAIPVLETWDQPADPLGDVVGFSNAAAAKLMVRHFVDMGFKRPAFIGGDSSRDTRGRDRARGFSQGLAELGMDETRILAQGTPPITMRQGAQAVRQLLQTWSDTDAIMCVSDLSAFGALGACMRQGLHVPNDIAITGFGAYDVAELAIPSLTTIDVSAHTIGQKSAELLIKRLDGDLDAPTKLEIEPKLIIRESSQRT